jgi:GntR family transcriptional regulator
MRVEQISGIPLYVKTRERLRAELAQMKPGDPIPVEAELERRFGVSRITVRRAVEGLVAEGLLLRQQGRGTFVQKKLTHELNLITSWTEQLKRLGFTPKTAKLKLTSERPLAHVAEALCLKPGEEVIRVERIRLANREPISFMINYYPARLVPGLIVRKKLGESFYDLLEKEYNLVPAVAVDTVGTRPATAEEAAALKIGQRAPVLCVRRLTYLEGGTPLELANVASRGDRYQYQVTVHGRPGLESTELLNRLLTPTPLSPEIIF